MQVQLTKRVVFFSFCAGSLAGAAGWAFGQGLIATEQVAPVVLSGENVGFRMHGRKGDTPVGSIVVKIDGEWREVEFRYQMKLVK